MKSIKQTLMDRDGITADHADELIAEAREDLEQLLDDEDMENAYEICADHFGLEPDYLYELIPI